MSSAIDPAATAPAPAPALAGETNADNGMPDAANDNSAGVVKRALTYEVSCTSTVSGLPPVQTGRLVRGWRRRHLELEHPERENAKEDEEVYARTGTAYDISCQYLKAAHALALFQAEERQKKEWSYHTDSDDDEEDFGEDLKLEDIIVWDGAHPEQTAKTSTDAGEVVDNAIAKALAADAREEARLASKLALTALKSKVFPFVPASLAAAEEDVEMGDDTESLYAPDRSPIPSLQSVPPSPVGDLDLGERMVDVQWPTQDSTSTASSAEVEAEMGGAANAAPVATHTVQLVRINAIRYAQCGCRDGKHWELRTRETYAFEAVDGTVVVKKFRTMVVALD
ncbi:hypothetical protein R3P38DRAFT_3215415 [Favolaschia claudopus]|uniref:Uncharacterized protein n=1 Tax=Favolaschia claudopus TaxID=2862362 RepID=A0AAW0A8P8_9AGAR